MIDKLLVANRGEIAVRIMRTARRLGVTTVAVFSDADAGARHVREADEAIHLGGSPPTDSYLSVDAVLAAARTSGADAVHPGYGFLAEDARLATAVLDAGLLWVGPSPGVVTAMGDKIEARNLVAAVGMPVSRGTAAPVENVEAAIHAAASIGYPIMMKASAGGGGIGMSIASSEEDLRSAFATTQSRAKRFFASADILLETFLPHARHVEVQVLGLADGTVLALGVRDCSVQRRHQKLAEETPAPGVPPTLEAAMTEAAVQAAAAVDYRGAGTVELLLDTDTDRFVFLEMNTRLQVEHTVTELVYGVDIVEEQLRITAGDPPGKVARARPTGHAIELRVCAEDPERFLPRPGPITAWTEPEGPGIRVDAGYEAGDTVTPFYDPLLAKLCVWGTTREEVLHRARTAVRDFVIGGRRTNLPFFADLLQEKSFTAGVYDTSLVATIRPHAV